MVTLGDRTLRSRLLMGTARFPSPAVLKQAIQRGKVECVTVSLRRLGAGVGGGQDFFALIQESGAAVLPNTAGCRTVKEVVTTAHMARDMFDTRWIKLETMGDEFTLQPDPFALVEAARILIADGFEVFPYMTDDLVVADRLVHAGCRILMPWGSPIGSGQGLAYQGGLKAMRHRFPHVTLIVDAGLGAPSHACAAMEIGCDAVLVNTAIARASDPAAMAEAFAHAVEAGRVGYEAGLMVPRDMAVPSTPLIGRAFVTEGLL